MRLDDDAPDADDAFSPAQSRPATAGGSPHTFAGLLEDAAASSQEDDWTWLTNFGAHKARPDAANPKPNIKAKRKAHALLSQTIVEESSSG